MKPASTPPRRRALLSAGIVAVIMALAGTGQAGPWVPDRGHGYAKVAIRSLPGFLYAPGPTEDEPFPEPQPYGSYFEGSLSSYAELGLGHGTALLVNWDAVRVFVLEDPRDGQSQVHVVPGDVASGIRVVIGRRGRVVSAIETWFRFPVAPGEPVQTVYGTAEGTPWLGALQVGTGVWEGEAHLSLGAGFERFYLAASAGIAGRGGGFDSLFLWTAELGSPLGRGVNGRVKLNGRHPLGDGTAPYGQSPSGLGNGSRVMSFAVELDLPLQKSWVLALGFAGALGPVARQTYGPVFNLGLATTF
jgi:predicted RNA-binding protein YlqC (UPF0109 family)